MGKLWDVVSGKTYRSNKLVYSNVERVMAAVEGLSDESPVRRYVLANLAAVCALLEELIFETPEFVSPFRKHQREMSAEQAKELFLLLTVRFLVTFLMNESNLAWVRSAHADLDEFTNAVLRYSGGGENYFKDLADAFVAMNEQGNPAAWYIRVFRWAQQVGLGLPFDQTPDPVVVEAFTKFCSHCYIDCLIPTLTQFLARSAKAN